VKICLDASLLVDLMLPTPGARIARLWREWVIRGFELLAPTLVFSEVASALRRLRSQGQITPEEAMAGYDAFLSISLSPVSDKELARRAWELADLLGLRRPYDMFYVALAEREGCELWTTDNALRETTSRAAKWVEVRVP
jgi:predicted nucleic acid-binding protein